MTTALELDERYGRTRSPRALWIIGAVVAVIVIIIASWMTIDQSMDSVVADDLGFEVVDEHSVLLHFQVTEPQGRDVVCALEALDEEFGVVGWKVLEIPADGGHSQRLSTVIPTVSEATTGLVNTCWVA
ncbi:DUF4307 domain-containing protein [Microbacterium sp. A588]